uniref:CPG4 domain-containing protein n=2 Tax=Wuchereria bancrofti TaxID=6293 RepID=A0A1I8ECK6_WUCBA
MKFEFAVLLLLNSITGTLQICDYITLVKCFINILDEWAWTLYELKDNVVTINENQCEHLRQLDLCIKDAGPVKHECEHSEILAASNTVSDLLIHRKNSGSFLKSYYLLTYACSQEGQEILRGHRECLMEERIGEMTLSAGTYLSERFLEHPDDQVCQEVNNKLQEYISAMKGICHSESAQVIMCKSLRNMFKGLHADKLHSCDFDCNIPQLDEIAEPGLATMVDHEGSLSGTAGEDNLIPEAVNEHAAAVAAADGGAPESHSLNSSSSQSTCLIHSISLLLTSIVFS